ncbi:MAG: O-antigen ligase family protein [Pseudomonadota bacterium]
MTAVKFAPVFAGLFVLWPLLAVLGAQGYSPLLALMAIGGLSFLRRPQWTAPGLWWLAVAWAATSSAWAIDNIAGGGVVTGGFGSGDFSIDATALRIALTALCMNLLLLSLRSVMDVHGPNAARVILGTGFVHLALVALTPLLFPIITSLIYTPEEAASDGLQNALRAINAFTLIMPLLLAWAWHTPPHISRRIGVVGCVIITMLSAVAMGNQAALLAVAAGLGAIGLVRLFPRSGYSILFTVAAAMVLAAPFVLGRVAGLAASAGITLPGSFQSRAWSWQVVSEKIQLQPLLGYGLEASGDWRETYSDYPDWLAKIVAEGGDEAAWSVYRVVPGHPHNMALELWAETGMIGAGIVALALLVTGFTAPRPARLPPVTRYALAGVFGATLVYFNLAYSLWNEAFWSSVMIAAVASVIVGRTFKRP